MKQTVKVLLVEDNRLLRDGVAAMLSGMPGINVVAALETGEKLLEAVGKHKPDVALLEPAPGGLDGVRLTASLTVEFPETKVVVMDLVAAHTDIMGFVAAGATGFLLKDSTPGDFLDAIRTVVGGGTALPPALTGPLFAQIIREPMQGTPPRPPPLRASVNLTRRERDVMRLVAEALSNKEIAERLHLSTATIKSHVHTILEKLTLHTRIHIAQYARANRGLDGQDGPADRSGPGSPDRPAPPDHPVHQPGPDPPDSAVPPDGA